MADPRRAYRVVDDFEAELCDYTGAPYAVAVNSCTNALTLALLYAAEIYGSLTVSLPRRTYVGVLQAVLNTGHSVIWSDHNWQRVGAWYRLNPLAIVDSARDLSEAMFTGWPNGSFTCLSFHAAKQLPLGRGGAILTDNREAADWFRAARMDGRPPGQPIEHTIFPAMHCPMAPDVAARGLDILSRWNDTGYSPPPLPPTDYPDLSLLDFSNSQYDARSNPAGASPVATNSNPGTEAKYWAP